MSAANILGQTIVSPWAQSANDDEERASKKRRTATPLLTQYSKDGDVERLQMLQSLGIEVDAYVQGKEKNSKFQVALVTEDEVHLSRDGVITSCIIQPRRSELVAKLRSI